MDALKSSLAQKASIYNDAANKVSFLTKLEGTEEEIHEGVNASCQSYLKDTGI